MSQDEFMYENGCFITDFHWINKNVMTYRQKVVQRRWRMRCWSSWSIWGNVLKELLSLNFNSVDYFCQPSMDCNGTDEMGTKKSSSLSFERTFIVFVTLVSSASSRCSFERKTDTWCCFWRETFIEDDVSWARDVFTRVLLQKLINS